MPFVMMNDEELKKQQEQQPGGQNISGSSTSFNVPGQTPSKPGEAQRSGQYQNIQKYLEANQPQGEAMGQKVAQEVEGKIAGAQQLGQQMKSEVKAPTAYDPSKVLSNLGSASDEEKASYKTMKQTGGYTGPSDLTGTQAYQTYQKQKEQATQALGQTGSDIGQQELLKQTYQRPDYTQGATALDQTIMRQSTGGKAAIEGIGSKYKDLLSTLGGYEAGTQEAIKGAQQQAQQNISSFAPAETTARQNILTPLEQRAAQANIEGAKYGEYLKDVEDLTLNEETLKALGLGTGTRVWDLNLGNYINQPIAQATAESIATQEERQKYNDLMNFLGTNTGEIGLNAPTYQQGAIDIQKLNQDIAAKNAEFEKFAKNRMYNESFGFSGQDSVSDFDRLMGNYGNWSGSGSTTTSLQDYLNQGSSAFKSGSSGRVGGDYNKALSDAQKKILSQIEKDLESYNYNNIIKGV